MHLFIKFRRLMTYEAIFSEYAQHVFIIPSLWVKNDYWFESSPLS